jgi:Tfp pilus assembly protein PilN
MRAVNLIPPEQRSGAAFGPGRSEGGAYAVLFLLGGLALLALLYGVARHQVSSRRAQLAAQSARTQQAQSEAERLAPFTSFIALREQREQTVSQLADSRFDWAHALHELGRVLPAGVSISSLSGEVGSTSSTASTTTSRGSGAAATSATPPGSVPSFSLSGCAVSQPAVAQTLDRLRLIDGVSEATLQSSTKGGNASTSAGGCPTGDLGFTVELIFEPLPAASAGGASASGLRSPSTASDSATAQPSTSTGGGR